MTQLRTVQDTQKTPGALQQRLRESRQHAGVGNQASWHYGRNGGKRGGARPGGGSGVRGGARWRGNSYDEQKQGSKWQTEELQSICNRHEGIVGGKGQRGGGFAGGCKPV